MTIIDAHLHLWDLDRAEYAWITPALAPINRSFRATEAEHTLRTSGVERALLVQAANSIEDSTSMFDVESTLVAGVVAWVDLLSPMRAAAQAEDWMRRGDFVGVRHLIHDEPDPDWLGRDEVRRSLDVLASLGLSFDVIGVLPQHLEHALRLADELPELTLVIDHLGSPPIGAESMSWWMDIVAELALRPRVFIKLSGLTTLPGAAGRSSLQPAFDHALSTFGPARMMYGGDWPVSTLAGEYGRTLSISRALTQDLSTAERADIFSGTAVRAYGLLG
jgi:L-fuconolactonase